MGSKTDGLMRDLRGFRRRVSQRFGIEKMILFGSRARGEAHEYSDVDLLVVSAKFRRKNIVERASPLHMEWDLDLPVDFLCYTPEEVRRLSRRPTLVREALQDGIPIPE